MDLSDNISLTRSTCVRLSKKEKKIHKHENKVKRSLSKLGLKFLSKPSKCVMITNVGHGTGLQEAELLQICLPHGPVEGVVMVSGMAYCFIVFVDLLGARSAYEALHGQRNPISTSPILYLAYVETVPGYKNASRFNMRPQGLLLYEDFVTDAEEEFLLNCVNSTNASSHSGKVLKQRRTRHYGYEFRYDTNNVEKDHPLPDGLPPECDLLWPRLQQKGYGTVVRPPDQLTVNYYEPGHGIPPHVDTHSAFEDPIISLSLGSAVVMDFKHPDGRQAAVVLPRRSLLVMSGEARYLWSHGIAARKTDVMPFASGGLVVQDRGARTSFTFRYIRPGECHCKYYQQCDTHQRRSATMLECAGTDSVAVRLESQHVLKVYEEIASHFSETRHKPWPNVLSFVQSLPLGAVLIDVGCGNGKYFGHNADIFEVGCDTSLGLSMVCRERGFEVINANCQHLPFRTGFADGCISVAVIHHLASQARRLRAVEEIVRILRPGGRALIYVWSKDQQRGMNKSAYLKQDKKHNVSILTSEGSASSPNCGRDSVGAGENEETCPCSLQLPPLPVHTNRTQFQHQDVFVPWIMKPSQTPKGQTVPTFYRYYHVFEEGELENLCSRIHNCSIKKSYYDQGNWCVILEKTSP